MRHVGSTHTDPAVLVGLDAPDDAAIYQVSDEVALVQTVDFFTPIVDDARDWGAIAAANAFSDVYAMGGRPVTALNLVGWPRALDLALLGEVLAGGEEVAHTAGVSIVGGHSIDDPEPKYGMAVTGTVHPERIVRKAGARSGDALVLTKPIGTGIISSGIKAGAAEAGWASEAVRSMRALNDAASSAMVQVGVSAATDVTGFGLVGHLLEMLGDDLDARLDLDAVPVLPGASELAAQGVLPGGSARNLEAAGPRLDAGSLADAEVAVICDAQTSGGLLVAVPEAKADELLQRSKDARVDDAVMIGVLTEGSGRVEVTRGG